MSGTVDHYYYLLGLQCQASVLLHGNIVGVVVDVGARIRTMCIVLHVQAVAKFEPLAKAARVSNGSPDDYNEQAADKQQVGREHNKRPGHDLCVGLRVCQERKQAGQVRDQQQVDACDVCNIVEGRGVWMNKVRG